jgi:excisionase family DNA binding protein
MWNAEIELDIKPTPRIVEKLATEWMPALADYHAAMATSRTGHVLVIISLPAETLRQATSTALAVVQDVTGRTATSVQVMTTEAFEARGTGEPTALPRLLSPPQAAEILGQSRQNVLLMLEQGRLPGAKVGNAWVVLASAVEAKAAAALAE